MPYRHIPVMLSEVVDYLNCQPGKTYLDGTIGGTGHTSAILNRIHPGGCLIGIDQDLDAIENAKTVLQHTKAATHLFHGNYSQFPEFLAQLNIPAVDGMLLDLGVSLHQLESSGRGFSFRREEPLDMRMDTRSGTRAEVLVNSLDEKKLAHLFKTYGEERWAKHIAGRIGIARQKAAIRSSLQLANIVSEAIPRAKWKPGRHPATRVFMALRIAVNHELDRLTQFMETFADYLKPGGRVCILTFHSLEDRIVKHGFKALAKACTCPPDFPRCVCQKECQVRILVKKGLRPTPEEISTNPMARSTTLRVAEKLS
ncbi:MAG: 16S rRNA (cytosine(1402)-N(4))-methyltransferase [Deltaproteobacteria bacterium]|nr:MAG: 16S rRNA (cytosine(1402)-N(4))-methyltransferase [Deltaproteobacteria bacterium]RLC11798.1 MAG: 16S rRNA (cytosine(1402)-N(4))-methyltransferase [Deltaproteobacteria bacterium]